MIQIASLIFGLFVMLVLDGIGLITGGFGFSLFGMLTGLVITGYTISDKDGLVIVGAVYNTNTSQWVYNTSPVYPFWIFGLAMLTLVSMIITIAILEKQRNGFDGNGI